MEAIIQQKCS